MAAKHPDKEGKRETATEKKKGVSEASELRAANKKSATKKPKAASAGKAPMMTPPGMPAFIQRAMAKAGKRR